MIPSYFCKILHFWQFSQFLVILASLKMSNRNFEILEKIWYQDVVLKKITKSGVYKWLEISVGILCCFKTVPYAKVYFYRKFCTRIKVQYYRMLSQPFTLFKVRSQLNLYIYIYLKPNSLGFLQFFLYEKKK